MLKKDRKISPTLKAAITHFQGPARYAAAIGASRQNVNHWLNRGFIDESKALDTEAAMDGRVTAQQILLDAAKYRGA